MKIIPVLHNVYSSQRVVEAARLVYGLGLDTFVVTKASGSAAQSGVPDAQKYALKRGLNFLFLKDLKDALELLNPDVVLTFSEGKYGGERLSSLLESDTLRGKERVVAVFGGAEPGLTLQEFKMGLHVFPDKIEDDIGSVGLMAISLYVLLNNLQEKM